MKHWRKLAPMRLIYLLDDLLDSAAHLLKRPMRRRTRLRHAAEAPLLPDAERIETRRSHYRRRRVGEHALYTRMRLGVLRPLSFNRIGDADHGAMRVIQSLAIDLERAHGWPHFRARCPTHAT